MKKAGIILIILGIVMMFITGFNYVTREKVVDIGDLEIKANKNHPVAWSPVVGGVLLVAGFVSLIASKGKAGF